MVGPIQSSSFFGVQATRTLNGQNQQAKGMRSQEAQRVAEEQRANQQEQSQNSSEIKSMSKAATRQIRQAVRQRVRQATNGQSARLSQVTRNFEAQVDGGSSGDPRRTSLSQGTGETRQQNRNGLGALGTPASQILQGRLSSAAGQRVGMQQNGGLNSTARQAVNETKA